MHGQKDHKGHQGHDGLQLRVENAKGKYVRGCGLGRASFSPGNVRLLFSTGDLGDLGGEGSSSSDNWQGICFSGVVVVPKEYGQHFWTDGQVSVVHGYLDSLVRSSFSGQQTAGVHKGMDALSCTLPAQRQWPLRL